MQANGGIMSAQMACEKSVNTVLSGPAAGVIAAGYITRQTGHRQVVTCDMGGTSFDAGIIVDDVPLVTSDRDLDFNLPMRIPIIDIHTIGAGGGSIARLNEAGMLEVGPRSAGASPGPIAYGRGGREPDSYRRQRSAGTAILRATACRQGEDRSAGHSRSICYARQAGRSQC